MSIQYRLGDLLFVLQETWPAAEAVAWTFAFTEEDYHPLQET
jgi:hypothetical protein